MLQSQTYQPCFMQEIKKANLRLKSCWADKYSTVRRSKHSIAVLCLGYPHPIQALANLSNCVPGVQVPDCNATCFPPPHVALALAARHPAVSLVKPQNLCPAIGDTQ